MALMNTLACRAKVVCGETIRPRKNVLLILCIGLCALVPVGLCVLTSVCHGVSLGGTSYGNRHAVKKKKGYPRKFAPALFMKLNSSACL